MVADSDRTLKKLGIGSEPGAGEAWKLAPAKAAEPVLLFAECGGVRRPGLAGPGEVETWAGRADLLLCFADLGWVVWEPGAGLAFLDFMGVVGKLAGKGMFVRTSPSDA